MTYKMHVYLQFTVILYHMLYLHYSLSDAVLLVDIQFDIYPMLCFHYDMLDGVKLEDHFGYKPSQTQPRVNMSKWGWSVSSWSGPHIRSPVTPLEPPCNPSCELLT